MPYQPTTPFANREITVPKKSNRELNIAPPPFIVVSTPALLRYGSRMRSALPLSFAWSANRGGSPFSC